MSLYRLLYTSVAEPNVSDGELEEILATARKFNPTVGLTGVLLFYNGTFLQVLEGNRSDVDELLARIAQDTRNSDIERVFEEDANERMFGDWSMAYLPVLSDGNNDLVLNGRFAIPKKIEDHPDGSNVIIASFLNSVLQEMMAHGGN